MENRFKILELKNKKGEVFFELGYDAHLNWGLTNWIGFLSVENVRAGGMAMLELILKHKIKFWLNDNRQVDGSWDAANEWIAEWWLPRVINAGLEKYSVIVPNDLPAELSTEFMADNALKIGLKMCNWKTEEQARAWLNQGEHAGEHI